MFRLLIQVFPQAVRLESCPVLYCPLMKRMLKTADIETWPGFKIKVIQQQNIMMLDVNLTYIMVRNENCLDKINSVIK